MGAILTNMHNGKVFVPPDLMHSFKAICANYLYCTMTYMCVRFGSEHDRQHMLLARPSNITVLMVIWRIPPLNCGETDRQEDLSDCETGHK